MRKRTSDLRIPRSDALLSHRDSTVSEVYYEVHMTRVLHTARISMSSWGLEMFSLSHARDKTKNIFLYFFTGLKTYHLPYSIERLSYSHLRANRRILSANKGFLNKMATLMFGYLLSADSHDLRLFRIIYFLTDARTSSPPLRHHGNQSLVSQSIVYDSTGDERNTHSWDDGLRGGSGTRDSKYGHGRHTAKRWKGTSERSWENE